MELRDRIAQAIRKAAAEQTYWTPGPVLSRIYADAVIAELSTQPTYCTRCGIPHTLCRRDIDE